MSFQRSAALVIITLAAFSGSVSARGYSLFIPPQETDKNISRWTNDHYVVMNPWVTPRNLLFLFIPGTKSKATNYQKICETASGQGYHAVSLQYPNDISVNAVCGKRKDLRAYENMRREILFGADFSPLIDISRTDCLENRLIKLLKYLATQFPLDGWEQFLSPNGTPRWSKILLAGHSQGGGHAALLGKYYPTAGVVMFSSMDYHTSMDKPADWVYLPGRTRLDKCFAVTHISDQTLPFYTMKKYWNAFGFKQKGPIVNIDQIGSPYSGAHTFATNIRPSRMDKDKSTYHNALCMDSDTPLTLEGRPLLSDIWIFLLNAPSSRQ